MRARSPKISGNAAMIIEDVMYHVHDTYDMNSNIIFEKNMYHTHHKVNYKR